MGFVVVGGKGRRGCWGALDARVEHARQFLADDGADHLKVVAGQHGVSRREAGEVLFRAPGETFAALGDAREGDEEAIYAAASWGGVSVSLAAARFGGKGHTFVEMPSSRSSFWARASEGVFPPARSWCE